MRRIAALAVTLLGTSPVWACPFCNSDTGQQVRANILGADFMYHVLVTALPFPILLGIVALLHFGWPRWKHRRFPVGRTCNG